MLSFISDGSQCMICKLITDKAKKLLNCTIFVDDIWYCCWLYFTHEGILCMIVKACPLKGYWWIFKKLQVFSDYSQTSWRMISKYFFDFPLFVHIRKFHFEIEALLDLFTILSMFATEIMKSLMILPLLTRDRTTKMMC